MENENQVGLDKASKAFEDFGDELVKTAKNANVGEILEQTKETIKELMKKDSLNVLVLGQTGAGKSTLINAVFGEKMARTGSGKPITGYDEPEVLPKHDNKKGLCIYDSQGFEVTNHSSIRYIKNFIMEQEQKEVDDQIHIAWICIKEPVRRVQGVEIEFYEQLKEHKIPTIVCITKAEQDKDENGQRFSDIVKKEFSIENELDCVRIRALEIEDDDGEIKPKIGIDKLLNRSYALLPESKENSLKKKQNYDKKMKRKAMKEEASSKATYYAGGAAAACASPIPFSDIALILPTQIAMIGHISKIYDLGLNEQSIKKIAVALAGVCAAGFGIRAALGNLLKLIPGLGSIAGGAINAAVSFGATKAMGTLYIEYLDSNFDDIYEGRGDDLSFDLKNFKSEKEVEEIIKEASSEYDKKN